ncbi:TetR/AcrR family transcriptional regulator [Enterococcus gilvus]|uniref:TetR/AcrR family transcriptional regulator n=1 Tax=Enterococcus hulanensis TaxID=2559929 RepID=UPI001C8BE58E|nr:TetR/AcrR family transcriptional regulator C-terminal domain-containing protein [Enterococcus hulanensis]MBX8938686.1 TetR/AcrR family transcriptional regulator [Enterococcus gilvus]MDT2618514.1 TetR/AcrR family transcriptional regulator C-terminal domain-containing protein [Enterococcus hulanensis]MDT2629659.1 TetR/AcrR family transcriptional regulator C-terminal domain-containing protein [Enterococcus hulanensis]MDT2657391.1 TetR/AcrR family transcriptional regulator C-terminal domain-cont
MAKERSTQTKAKLKNSFIKLVREKGLDNVTVSDLARDSKINRGTFYLHYLDKYDLMEKLEEQAINDLKQILLFDKNTENLNDPIELIPYDAILKALIYVKNDFDFIKTLASDGGDPNFILMIKEILSQMIDSKIQQSEKLTFSQKMLPEDYAREILLSSMVAILVLWIKKDAAESPEEIAVMITKAKQISPYELLL